MRYSKREAKSYAKTHLRGIWAAALQPFHPDGSIDEEGFRGEISQRRRHGHGRTECHALRRRRLLCRLRSRPGPARNISTPISRLRDTSWMCRRDGRGRTGCGVRLR